jgi:hypothetical protein
MRNGAPRAARIPTTGAKPMSQGTQGPRRMTRKELLESAAVAAPALLLARDASLGARSAHAASAKAGLPAARLDI